MLGEGARMVVMAIFHQNWFYQPNAFDLFFDWVPLTILGSVFFYEGIRSFYIDKAEERSRSDEVPLLAIKNKHRSRSRMIKHLK